MNLANNPSQNKSSFGESRNGGTKRRASEMPITTIGNRLWRVTGRGIPTAGEGDSSTDNWSAASVLVINAFLESQQARRPDHDETDHDQKHRHAGHPLVDFFDPDRKLKNRKITADEVVQDPAQELKELGKIIVEELVQDAHAET